MANQQPRLIRPLTDLERLCLDCEVPDACDDEHALCQWRALGGFAQKPLSAKTIELRERRHDLLQLLDQVDDLSAPDLAVALNCSYAAMYRTLINLRAEGLVECVGWSGAARWRLTDG